MNPNLCFVAAACACGLSHAACAQDALSLDVIYTADLIGTSNGSSTAGRYLDNLDVVADLDLEKAVGWRGATLHAYGLNNSGGQPGAATGVIQGVDNIEVTRARARLYELWLEQEFLDGRASARVGLYDLNSEFYATASSDLLIGPSFGIGPELAATGSNGPSIFPSTSLAARIRLTPVDGVYVQAALLNAEARTIGDPGGVDTSFDQGALAIVEGGIEGDTRLAFGAWRYTRRQDDLRELTLSGEPAKRPAAGAYLLAEQTFKNDDGPQLTAFFRGGLSDGDTTAFRGGWQAGVTIERIFDARPKGVVSVGFHQALLSKNYRANGADEGLDLGPAESGVELTYSEQVAPRLTLQPNLQYIRRPSGNRDADDVTVFGVRFILDLG